MAGANDRALRAALQGRWVAVTGQVQFHTRERNGQKEEVTVIYVQPDPEHDRPLSRLVQPTDPPADPFLT